MNRSSVAAQSPGAAFTPLLVLAAALAASPGLSRAGAPATPEGTDVNLVPNARLASDQGIPVENTNGLIPTAWRAFAIGGGEITITPMPLAADALFAGSPAATAIKVTINSFGTDQGFDHATHLFQVVAGRPHAAEVWLRTGNADDSDQMVNVSAPLFSEPGVFTGRDPGAFQATATDSWQRFAGPTFTEAEDAYGHVAFRPAADGGENSVLIALPSVAGAPQANEVPNPGFAGGDGFLEGSIKGAAPDGWRAFAVDGGTLIVDILPAFAGELFPGSPETNVVQLDARTLVNGQGFDHEATRFDLQAGFPYYATAWVRSGNPDESPQGISLGMPVFEGDTFAGRQVAGGGTVGADWTLIATPLLIEVDGTNADLVFRPIPDGGDDVIQIALPRVVGPAPQLIFRSGFEAGESETGR